MAENTTYDPDKNQSEEIAQNAASRTAEINQNPAVALEESRNAAEGKAPNAAGGTAPSTAAEHVPSTSEPYASDLPSSDSPNPQADNSEEEET